MRHPGSASFDPQRQEFILTGAGANMWDMRDECHFAWTRVTGDVIITAEVRLVGAGVEPHRKLGVMIRDSLAPEAAYVDALVHGDGATAMQYRRAAGGPTEQIQAPHIGAAVVQLERRGGVFTMRVAHAGEPFSSPRVVELPLQNEAYVGLFVCSHNAEAVETGVFRNVRIVRPAAEDFTPYRDYIGSNLEILDVATGRREVVHRVSDSLQAPNWTGDGKALIYN
ncbi:MAG TPA: hypothetical protein VEQ85_16640, partial [Lacipirellulaceae bacterium]|nr:hypothetical protein [Lacipirellulaceae bacterium]